jgi:FlaA1/EpsC-like NDP-sugar epimerase
MDNKVIIVGASGQARVVIDIVECEGRLSIVGILDRKLPAGTQFQGYKVLGSDEEAERFAPLCDCAIVAVGDNFVRSLVVEKVGRFIHSAAPFIPHRQSRGGLR